MIGSIVYWHNDQWVVQRKMTRAERLRSFINSPGLAARHVSSMKTNSFAPSILEKSQGMIYKKLREWEGNKDS